MHGSLSLLKLILFLFLHICTNYIFFVHKVNNNLIRNLLLQALSTWLVFRFLFSISSILQAKSISTAQHGRDDEDGREVAWWLSIEFEKCIPSPSHVFMWINMLAWNGHVNTAYYASMKYSDSKRKLGNNHFIIKMAGSFPLSRTWGRQSLEFFEEDPTQAMLLCLTLN